MPRIRAFHDALFEHYRETMSGDRNLLFRMKDLWSYMLEEVPDSEKLAKKIRKSQHVPEYLAAVDEAFAGWERTILRKEKPYAATDQTESFLMDRYI